MATSFRNLAELIGEVRAHKGSWGTSRKVYYAERNSSQFIREDAELALGVNAFLWETYDQHAEFIYPNIESWDSLLEETTADNSYDTLSKDEVLSILFGLHHRHRVVDGLWCSMFEQGVSQKLLERLLALDSK